MEQTDTEGRTDRQTDRSFVSCIYNFNGGGLISANIFGRKRATENRRVPRSLCFFSEIWWTL